MSRAARPLRFRAAPSPIVPRERCVATPLRVSQPAVILGEETNMARLAGKVALISGGARGQGAVEAQMFTQEGARVVFGDILDEEGRQVEAAIRAQGGDATYVHLNVTREEDWQQAVQTAEATYG